MKRIIVFGILWALLVGAANNSQQANAAQSRYKVTCPVLAFSQDVGSFKADTDPAGGKGQAGRIDYKFEPNRFAFTEYSTSGAAILGTPQNFAVDIYGDGSGMMVGFRFTDRSGELYQLAAQVIDWKGWRTVEFNIPANVEHWGGDGNGKMDLPMAANTFVVAHHESSNVKEGRLYFRNFRVTTLVDSPISAKVIQSKDLAELPKIQVENLLDTRVKIVVNSELETVQGTFERVASAVHVLAPHAVKILPMYTSGPTRVNGEIVLARTSVVVTDSFKTQDFAVICGTPKPVGPKVADVFGMNVHLERFSHEDVWKLLRMLKAAGITSTRVGMGFAPPDKKTGYSEAVTYADWVVLASEAFGLDSMGSISYFPPEFYNSPEKLRMARDWAVALAKHFKGRVYSWQYGNETNAGWGAYGAAADMAALNNAFAEGTLSVNPAAKTGTLGVAEAESGYVRALFDNGAGNYMNAVSIHPYGGTAEASIGQCLKIRQILGGFGGNKEIWADEIGFYIGEGSRINETTGQLASSSGSTLDQQADHLVRLYTLAKSKSIERVYWYDFTGKNDPENFWIIDSAFKPRPAYTCLYNLAKAIKNTKPIGGTDIDELVQRQYFRRDDGSVVLVAWALSDGVQANLHLPRRLSYKDFLGKPGNIPADGNFILGNRPILIEGLTTKDIRSFVKKDVMVNALDARSFSSPQHRWSVGPGETIKVPCVVYNTTGTAMHVQPVVLRTQPGWNIKIPASANVQPGQTVTPTFEVTAPANAVPGVEYHFDLAAEVNGLSRSLPYTIRVKTKGAFPYDDYLAERGHPDYPMWDSFNEAASGTGRSEYAASHGDATVDGDISEWSPAEFYPIDQKLRWILRDPWETDRLNWTGRVALRWDENNLYAAFVVLDDDLCLLDFSSRDWRDNDHVRLFLSTEPDPDKRQYAVSEKDFPVHIAPTGESHTEAPVVFCSSIGGYIHKGFEPRVSVASRVWTGGYVIEAKIPFSAMNYTPVSGSVLGLNILAMDADNGHRQSEIMSYFKNTSYWNSPKSLGNLTLLAPR